MSITRREFLTRTTPGVVVAAALARQGWAEEAKCPWRLFACDWSIRAVGPEGLEVAARIGLQGVEASAGDPADTVKIADSAYRQEYKDGMKKTGVVVASVAMSLLNQAPLASDPRGPAWLEQCIDATKDLGAKVLLLAFFGQGDLRSREGLKLADIDVVVERLKDAAPKAEKTGVVIGLENTLSGKDNMDILNRVKSDAVQVYYDTGNSTYNGYDVPEEIRALGDRICQFHFKDGAKYLGEGKVDMPAVAEAIRAIGFKGWLGLETAIRSKDRDADFRKNAAYVRKLFNMPEPQA